LALEAEAGGDVVADAGALTESVGAVFAACGSAPEEARAIAENLVAANLAGHDSHGVGVVPLYVRNAGSDAVHANQHVSVLRDSGPVVQLDGNLGYGQVIGAEAMAIGIAKAGEAGVAILALRNSHHLGRIGAWAELCADAGLVSIHYVNINGHKPLVAPFGGTQARFATNPYCTAIPGTDAQPPIVLDMATSKIAFGKVRVAHNTGEVVADGTLTDPAGVATNDPGTMFRDPRGALLPFGEHKGYGLALICEVLAGALVNGGGCVPGRQGRESLINNMLSIILDPAALGDTDFFRSELDEITRYVKSSAPAAGVDAVMLPGDPERKQRAARGADGIRIDATTWREILDAAESVGLSPGDMRI
jgi:uncharacterized oxidoreductase